MIPKIIHYCWFGKRKIPASFRRYIASWRKLCPDYKIICWNEDTYDLSKNPFLKSAADNKKWAFVSDYLRMDVLYEYGGIYLDTDVELLKSFDPLLKYDGFAGFECSEFVNFGSAVGVIPEHPIIREMKEKFESMIFSKECESISTGPLIQTEILEHYGLKKDRTEQDLGNFHIFPQTYFCPMDYMGNYTDLTDKTYSVHHFSATWFEGKQMLLFKIMRLKTFFKRLFQHNKKRG